MKRALFIPLLFLSYSIFSQQWTPFIATDTLVHYKDDKSAWASGFIVGPSSDAYAIQSISVKSSFTQSNQTFIEFERGYPLLAAGAFSKMIYGPDLTLAKGRLLGDFLTVSRDSSIFVTIDSSGFRLSFPHSYVLNQQWTFGKSEAHRLEATVIAVYQSTILDNQIDSLARFSIAVYNRRNVRVSSHKFDGVNLLISKYNGLIKTADFTELQDTASTSFEKFALSNQPIYNNDYNLLSVGDEYHFETIVDAWDGLYESRQHISKIISDTTVGSIRTLLIEDRWRDIQPPNAKGIDTTQRIFNINTIKHNKKSMIISQSEIANGQGRTQMLFYQNNYPLASFFEYETEFLLRDVNSFGLLQLIDMMYLFSGDTHYGYIGYPFSRREFRSFGFPESKDTTQVYRKRGNIATGIPFIFSVGIKENNSLDRQVVTYPNPVKDIVEIQTDLKVESVILYAVTGQLLLEVSNTKRIDVGHLNSGAYILKVITEKGVVTKNVLKD